MQIFASTLVKFAKNFPYFRPILPPPPLGCRPPLAGSAGLVVMPLDSVTVNVIGKKSRGLRSWSFAEDK